MEIAPLDIFLVVPIVCACPAAWGIGNLHQAAAVEEEPCPSAVCSISPGAVELVEEEALGRLFSRLCLHQRCRLLLSSRRGSRESSRGIPCTCLGCHTDFLRAFKRNVCVVLIVLEAFFTVPFEFILVRNRVRSILSSKLL